MDRVVGGKPALLEFVELVASSITNSQIGSGHGGRVHARFPLKETAEHGRITQWYGIEAAAGIRVVLPTGGSRNECRCRHGCGRAGGIGCFNATEHRHDGQPCGGFGEKHIDLVLG
ncbi:MAG: hypothetical protein CMJ40_11175 [Phycisphaerae bacterium]|nr:hypothetical protein [Phycisphaerae bacterium]